MTAWMTTMTGNLMAQFGATRKHVPFKLLFKSVIGFAVLGLVVVGAILAFVRLSAPVELTFQILAVVVGAAIGAYGAWRAAGDASSKG
jgi:hypothetical protein